MIRFSAWFIDQVIIVFLSSLIGFLGGFIILLINGPVDEKVFDVASDIFGLIIGVTITYLYYVMMESSELQATIGKRVLGLSVTNDRYKQLSFGQATRRYFGKFASGMFFGIGFFMIAFDEEHRGLHDKLAHTYVIYR